MAKQIKDNVIHARVDNATNLDIRRYAYDADKNIGQVIRLAVREYMHNHPVKAKSGTNDISKFKGPGE